MGRMYQIQFRDETDKHNSENPTSQWQPLIIFPMDVETLAQALPIAEKIIGPDFRIRIVDMESDEML